MNNPFEVLERLHPGELVSSFETFSSEGNDSAITYFESLVVDGSLARRDKGGALGN